MIEHILDAIGARFAPLADIRGRLNDVRFVPKADIAGADEEKKISLCGKTRMQTNLH